MYQNEQKDSDRMVLFTDFNINPILLFFTHAPLKKTTISF